METIVCKCGHRRDVAGELRGRPLLSAVFAFFDVLDMGAAGWSVGPDGRWRCLHCTRRSRLMRPIDGGKFCNVTEPRHRRDVLGNATSAPACRIMDPPTPSEEK